MSPTLEELLTSTRGCGLTKASALQRDICRIASGEPAAYLSPEQLELHFGAREIQAQRAELVALICGVRGGKSWIAAAAAIHACLTVDLSEYKQHELPRYVIIGPDVDTATATFRIVVGCLESSPALQQYIDGEPTVDTVTLRRPDGHRCEIVVVAAKKGGLSVRNRWLVGFVFEEVAQFGSENEGAAVNVENLVDAAETRLLPGCQGWLISSPWGPEGLLYEVYTEHFGKPGERLVVHASTRAMNPSFPQQKIDRIRKRRPDVAAREYDAQWIDAATALFNGANVDTAVRKGPARLPYAVGHSYAAAIDPSKGGNGFTLVVATRSFEQQWTGEGTRPLRTVDRWRVVLAREWRGSKTAPLVPKRVFAEVAAELKPYGVTVLASDHYNAGRLRRAAAAAGLVLHAQADSAGTFTTQCLSCADMIDDGQLELAPALCVRDDRLEQCDQLSADLKLVRRRTSGTRVTAILPKTRNGRHCDFVPALVRVLGQPIAAAEAVEDKPPRSPELVRYLAGQRRRALEEGYRLDDEG